jgi:hypothetical protein
MYYYRNVRRLYVHTTTVCVAARQPKIEPLKTATRIFEPETHTFNIIIYGLRRRNGSRRMTAATHTHTNVYTRCVRSGTPNNRI